MSTARESVCKAGAFGNQLLFRPDAPGRDLAIPPQCCITKEAKRQAQMPDASQFETFMRNYQDMVFSTAMRLLANQAEAEDVSQEVFLRAYNHFHELEGSPTAGGWLRTVATNLCLNHLSRYRARWTFFSDFFAPKNSASEEDQMPDFASPEDILEALSQADGRELLEQALQKLPASQRVPLVLFHMENLSYEEIAVKLKVSMGKVKTDIFRAREALRKKLRASYAGELSEL